MNRHILPAALGFIPALFLAACASQSSPAEGVSQPSNDNADSGNTAEVVSGSDTSQAGGDAPSSTNPPTPEPLPATAVPQLILPDLGPAPDIRNEVWLNTDQPLNLAALRGRVVLVEFWTFG